MILIYVSSDCGRCLSILTSPGCTYTDQLGSGQRLLKTGIEKENKSWPYGLLAFPVDKSPLDYYTELGLFNKTIILRKLNTWPNIWMTMCQIYRCIMVTNGANRGHWIPHYSTRCYIRDEKDTWELSTLCAKYKVENSRMAKMFSFVKRNRRLQKTIG